MIEVFYFLFHYFYDKHKNFSETDDFINCCQMSLQFLVNFLTVDLLLRRIFIANAFLKMHNNCYPVNSNDNIAYSGSYTELVNNHHGMENDFANIFLVNEQANQLHSQLYISNSQQNDYSAQIETHTPQFQYTNNNNTDYLMNNYQHDQSGK